MSLACRNRRTAWLIASHLPAQVQIAAASRGEIDAGAETWYNISRSVGRSGRSAWVSRNGASRTTSGPEGSSVKRDTVVRRSKGKTSLLHREKAFLVSHERAFPHHRAPLSPRRTQGLRGRNDYRTAGGMTHGVYRTLSEMAAEDLRRPRRAGACLQDALAGHRLGAHRPRLPLRGAARHRQDEHGEDPRHGAQLRARADA